MATDNPALRHILDRARELRGTVDGWPKLIGEIEAVCAPPPGEAEITAWRESATETHAEVIDAGGGLSALPDIFEVHVDTINEAVALMRRAAAPTAASKALREAALRAEEWLRYCYRPIGGRPTWCGTMLPAGVDVLCAALLREALAADAAKETPQ